MAPRSTGCRSCVRRHVKCDARRPHCDRCRKAKLQCDGFRDALVFVDETRDTLRRLAPLQTVPVTTPMALRRSPPTFSDPESELAFCRRLGLSAFSENVYFSYLLDTIIGTSVKSQDHSINRNWMVVRLSRQEEYPTATLALRCLATNFFGRKHHQNSIVQDGVKVYGQALLALRQVLQDPIRAWGFDALATTTALSSYEWFMFTTRQGWIQHAQGVAKLIEMRGPARFQQWPDRAILEANKLVVIAQSLAARKRSFLEKDEWRNLYRLPEPEKHFISSLSQTSSQNSLALLRQFKGSKLSNLIQELEDWYTLFTMEFGQVALEVSAKPGASITSDADGNLFSTLLDFANLDLANAFTNHRAIKIAALEWQHKLADLSWQREVDHEGMLEIPAASELALDICRSVEYHLRPAHAQAGAFDMLMPARMAYFALPRSSREAQWLARMLEHVSDTSGFELARNVLNNIPIRKKKLVGGKEVLKYSPATSGSTPELESPSIARTSDAA